MLTVTRRNGAANHVHARSGALHERMPMKRRFMIFIVVVASFCVSLYRYLTSPQRVIPIARSRRQRGAWTAAAAAALSIASNVTPVRAQETPVAAPVTDNAPDSATQQDPPIDDRRDAADTSSRLFGVLPNPSTIEPETPYAPITTRQSFAFATEESFDKAVYPFVGVVAFLGVGQPTERYGKRYAKSFADNTVGNYMVTAVLPTAFGQDPRYFVRGSGNVFGRIGYAATRSVVTRSRDGRTQFNVSEIGGNVMAAIVSDLYYPPGERGSRTLLARAASQVMWDTISFECKEFWPDIRRMLQQIAHRQ